MNKPENKTSILTALIFILILATVGYAQTTEFTYQGKLTDVGGQPAAYDFEFRLCVYETLSCSPPLATFTKTNVAPSSGGIFTIKVDFGNGQFSNGTDRYVEVAVRRTGASEYTTLAPRQEITSAPYAIFSSDAGNAISLGGRSASQYVLTTDPRLSATNYVQNGTTAQTGVNFNVGGTGTANVLNAGTQFNLGGTRFLSGSNIANVFAGKNAGAANTTGDANSFFGYNAGQLNTSGDNNSFFGIAAGGMNTTGRFNSFFGGSSGEASTTGGMNSFFGSSAGGDNTSGNSNSFFGNLAGGFNTIGGNNTALGANANFTANNLNFATALGAGATVGTSNTLVLGRPNDAVQAPGSFSAGGSVNAGMNYRLGGSLFISIGGNASNTYNTYVGVDSSCNPANGSDGIGNTFVGFGSGIQCTTGSQNTVIGYGAGRVGTGDGNTLIGTGTRVAQDATVNDSTAIGAFATVSTSNTIVLGRPSATTQIPGKFNALGGESGASTVRLPLQTVVSTNSTWGEGIAVNSLHIGNVSRVFVNSPLCFQAGIGVANHVTVGLCPNNNAQGELKTDLKPFNGGVEIVKRLQPMSFRWKDQNSTGVGLNAEDVAAVDANLVSRDEKGEITKVDENSLNAVLVNSIKEQQLQIEAQQKQIDQLKKIVCAMNVAAEVCKEK